MQFTAVSLCVLSDILRIKKKRSVCQMAVMGSNVLVKGAHCQQSIHHTPTGMAEHLGVQVLTRYLVSACVTLRENTAIDNKHAGFTLSN